MCGGLWPVPCEHCDEILNFVDRASVYNLVNKANLVHSSSQYIYFSSLHVSGNYVPIIRRNYSMCATLVFVTLYGMNSNRKTRQRSIRSDKYQVSHRYSNFSWWWAHSCLKHVQKRNKYTKKNCAPSWLYLQDCGEKWFPISLRCRVEWSNIY